MRLTRTMKDDFFNIIKNKTVRPTKKIDKYVEELQQIFYEQEPLFKQYVERYGLESKFRESVAVATCKVTTSYSFNLFAPNITILKQHLLINEKGSTYYITIYDAENVKEPFKDTVSKMLAIINEQDEYDNVLRDLQTTINSCNTSKQLADMYPEFMKYFNKAGIVEKTVKQLPATLGLPQNLTKFGLVLESEEEKEAKQKELEEIIKEDIEDSK